ncbi:MAG TPA: ACT domain-containing protein [Candidatus Sumerlaeota bacterium]|nr:ACT domain-containing protein [Candidatus Sumerlaeota bacterium]
MKLRQLSLFLENRAGQLAPSIRLLAEAGINIKTLSLADTEQFGILHLIVSDWEKARDVLTGAGFAVNVAEVVAVEVPDRPGGLAGVLEAIGAAGLNIEYMYAFTFNRRHRAVLIFRFTEPDAALAKLAERGVAVLDDVELGESMEAIPGPGG